MLRLRFCSDVRHCQSELHGWVSRMTRPMLTLIDTSTMGWLFNPIFDRIRMMAFRVKSVFDILHSNASPSHVGHKNLLSIKVSIFEIACNSASYIMCYILAGAGCIYLCRETAISNSLQSSSYRQRVIGHQSLEG